MRKVAVVATVGLTLLIAGCDLSHRSSLNSNKEKYSYAIGMDIGRAMSQRKLDLEPQLVGQGIKDTFNKKTLITEEEARKLLMDFQKEQMAQQEKTRQEDSQKNKAAGDKFLAENKVKPGVTTLPSGVQYKVIKSGTGLTPKATDTVKVHYRGRLIDGTEFDSSYKRNEPATFPVNAVIPGWTEVLQLMKVGDKWDVVIPSNLAYGEQGAGQQIGPNSVLLFEVELINVEPTSPPNK